MAATAQVSTSVNAGITTGGMESTLRGVSVRRLSVLTDETTSPERQQAANEDSAAALGISLGDRQATDLGVSASKTSPFDRPELGEWLAKPDEFDALCFWRFDRAVRSMSDMNELAAWARKHRKMIVFAEGPGGRLVLDFRRGVDLITQLILQIFAFAAEFEAQAITERVSGAQAAMRAMPLRWRGGQCPYGYTPVPLEGGGWTLELDTDAVAVLELIIGWLHDSWSATAIAAELNRRKIPSPSAYRALTQGKESKRSGAWSAVVIRRLLRSVALLGWKADTKGRPVRDSSGTPVVAAETPLLTRAEFDAVGALLDATAANMPRDRCDTRALLKGVIVCGVCGGPMYLARQRGDRERYKCNASSNGKECAAPVNIRGDWADGYTESEFLRRLGALQVTETREIPGYDPQPEIDATLREFEEHQGEAGRQRSKAAAKAWQERADALDARLAELESREVVPARVEVISKGVTYATLWESSDVAGRRAMLKTAGATIRVQRGKPGGWRSLDPSRVAFDLREPYFSEAATALASL